MEGGQVHRFDRRVGDSTSVVCGCSQGRIPHLRSPPNGICGLGAGRTVSIQILAPMRPPKERKSFHCREMSRPQDIRTFPACSTWFQWKHFSKVFCEEAPATECGLVPTGSLFDRTTCGRHLRSSHAHFAPPNIVNLLLHPFALSPYCQVSG